jgi:hypothetical protein
MNIDPQSRNRFEQRLSDSQRLPTLEDFSSLNEARDFVEWCLEGSYTDAGIEIWWSRPRAALQGRAPTEQWLVSPDEVINLAISVLT